MCLASYRLFQDVNYVGFSGFNSAIPADIRRWIKVGLTLIECWTNVKPALIQRLVSSGMANKVLRCVPHYAITPEEYYSFLLLIYIFVVLIYRLLIAWVSVNIPCITPCSKNDGCTCIYVLSVVLISILLNILIKYCEGPIYTFIAVRILFLDTELGKVNTCLLSYREIWHQLWHEIYRHLTT